MPSEASLHPPHTPRQRFIDALERKPLRGRVPHFELVFYLTMEAFGKLHPLHRDYSQWFQMEEKERELHRRDMASVFIETAECYEHSAIFVHPNPGVPAETVRLIEIIREQTGDKYFLMKHGDVTLGIPSNGKEMMELAVRLKQEPGKLKAEAQQRVNETLERAEKYYLSSSLDGMALCTDYCTNTGPFMRPSQFSEFVTPYLAQLIKGYREMGFYTIKHTDGNIMPILDQLLQTNPHALHSLDPQAGVDMAQVKKMAGTSVCLMGNVDCGLLDRGREAQVVASARYALHNGMPSGGYVFSTSNCIYTGMPLERYDLMLKVWREEGNYE
jgi:uroporphyrinogen decarboxylase